VAPVAASTEPASDFFVGEAKVDVTKDETVVRLAMAQHGSVLIELPANDGPRYIIPGDPEMATVDEKALERNKRAIIVRPGTLFLAPAPSHKKRTPAATVTAQMRSGLVVTFLFYPVEDLAQNVHRCVLSYNRDEVVARRRAAGLPVNLDNKEQGGEKQTGQSAAPISISVDPSEAGKSTEPDKPTEGQSLPNATITISFGDESKPKAEAKPTMPLLQATPTPTPSLTAEASGETEPVIAAARAALARATAKPGKFKGWTKPAHGLALAAQQSSELKDSFRVVVVAVRNTSGEPLKLTSGNPDLTLEMVDDAGKVINVQSIKSLHQEVSDPSGVIAAGKIVYYAIAYVAPVLGVRQQLRIVVAQTNAADEPASIALAK